MNDDFMDVDVLFLVFKVMFLKIVVDENVEFEVVEEEV